MKRPNYAGWHDMEGLPITEAEWNDRYGYDDTADNPLTTRSVARTKVGDVLVDTVLLSIPHGWEDDRPIIFETMVFSGDLDEQYWRYTTRAEAEAGHARIAAIVKADTA